jgi:lysophospholipase L1-like esterase
MLKINSKHNTVITLLFVLLSIQNILSNANKNESISKNYGHTKVIACVGDSLTEGAGNPLANSYPGLLQNHFNESRYKV